MSPTTPAQKRLQFAIEQHLFKIECILGLDYKLTLIGKYHGPEKTKDLDILLTRDTPDNMVKVINRFYPQARDESSTTA